MGLFTRKRTPVPEPPQTAVFPTPEPGDYPGSHDAEVTGIEFVMEPAAHTVTIYRVKIRNDHYSGGYRVAIYRQHAYSVRLTC